MTTFSVKQLCGRYCVGECTVLGWIRTGQLAAINVGRAPGKKKPRWRVTEAACQAFELARTVAPPPVARRRRKSDPQVVEFYK